jgi:hypothetical protein
VVLPLENVFKDPRAAEASCVNMGSALNAATNWIKTVRNAPIILERMHLTSPSDLKSRGL